jgi:hypothetical protein
MLVPIHLIGSGDNLLGSIGLPSLGDRDLLAVHVHPDLAVDGDKTLVAGSSSLREIVKILTMKIHIKSGKAMFYLSTNIQSIF